MTAANVQIIFPMCALFFLTLAVLVKMFIERVKAVKSGEMKFDFFRTYDQGTRTPKVAQADRHFANLFEMPVLYYVVCLLGLILGIQSVAFVVVAWLYVVARVVHAIIHLGTNRITYRMRAYGMGCVMLMILWVMVLLRAVATLQVASL